MDKGKILNSRMKKTRETRTSDQEKQKTKRKKENLSENQDLAKNLKYQLFNDQGKKQVIARNGKHWSKYITSIERQLTFASQKKFTNIFQYIKSEMYQLYQVKSY